MCMFVRFSCKDIVILNNVIYYMYLIIWSKFKGNIYILFEYEYELYDCGINVICIYILYVLSLFYEF